MLLKSAASESAVTPKSNHIQTEPSSVGSAHEWSDVWTGPYQQPTRALINTSGVLITITYIMQILKRSFHFNSRDCCGDNNTHRRIEVDETRFESNILVVKKGIIVSS